ncbi:hypothetical protein [Altericista sp. CCNU0014]|uniref:hypothetical protein n=1 Tax=Altericista sp. CCNU0014 TaxID=3082949 RepID=UPI00384E9C64
MSDRNSKKFIDLANVKIDLPLFNALLALKREIKTLLPGKDFRWLDALGIRLEEPTDLENGGYYCTPINTLKFASTGMDGEHFSFLVCDNAIDSESPVILTMPCNYGGATNVVIAKSFRTFLCLGLRYGYFALGELASNPEEAMQVYANAQWIPTEERHFLMYVPNETQQTILAFIANSLDLQPYTYTADEFAALQNRYVPLLSMSDEYYEACED